MIIISQNIQVSVIVQNYDASDMDELLESLINQTHDNLEIICLTDNLSDIESDYNLTVKETDSFKIEDVHGDYVIFAKPSDQFYLVALESLLDYSLDNELELLLFSPIDYDVKTKEIYEKSKDSLNEISRDIKKNKFSFDDLSRHAFSLNPEINGIFYKKSFCTDCFSDESFSSLNTKFLFFKSIINSQSIGIFKNQVYIKKDLSRYKLKTSQSLNDVYYGLENCSAEDINELCLNISDLFKKSNRHRDYQHDLADLKMNFYKEILSDNESVADFEYVKDDLNLNYDSSDFNNENAALYKGIMDLDSLSKEKIFPITNLLSIQKQPNEDNSSQKISKTKDEPAKQKKSNEESSSSDSWKSLSPVRRLKKIFKR